MEGRVGDYYLHGDMVNAEPEPPHHYGGQAVINGVMMRGRYAMAVAVRDASGQVVLHSEPLDGIYYRHGWAKRPFIRGVLLLAHSVAIGLRSLAFSANLAIASARPALSGHSARVEPRADSVPGFVSSASDAAPPEGSTAQGRAQEAARKAFGGRLMWGSLATALLLAIGLFFVLPVLLARTIEALPGPLGLLLTQHAFGSLLLEGLLRIGIVLLYLWAIGRMPMVQQVFAYHGAEHKAVNAFEAGEPLVTERVARYSVAHPRCGTSFLLYVVVLSLVVFAVLGTPPLPVRLLTRVVFVPVLASIAYEVLRLVGSRSTTAGMRFLLAPGMLLQSLTTREPDRAQVEVAVAALNLVVELDNAHRHRGLARLHAP
jgi:uncharacterized protein YqhQ